MEQDMNATTTRRFDGYAPIHKALRACMANTLAAVGRMDPEDTAERAEVLAGVREMLAICHGHLEKEERYIHPAMEQRAPGSSRQTAKDHADHGTWFQDLEADVVALERGAAGTRQSAAAHLYGRLAVFVGENLLHMHAEETDNNMVLWRTHSDAELIAIEQRIVASLSPAERDWAVRSMLPALDPSERAVMLRGMRAGMPAEAFAGLLAALRPRLSNATWVKLEAALGAQALAA
jgi:hypothetical protein